LRTSDFDYELPRELIAQYPADRRDESRLLVIRRDGGPLEHRGFGDIGDYVQRGDVLVVNESQVIPARLLGRRSTGGQAEMFLLRDLGEDRWEVLVRPGARIRAGSELSFGEGALTARVEEALPDGKRVVSLSAAPGPAGDEAGAIQNVAGAIEKLGAIPLPPYIDREPEPLDGDRYQTVYARVPGAVAAPTAGLHFTGELLSDLGSAGVTVARLTLHVGIGTFRPVAVDDPESHLMESERYEMPRAAAEAINSAREEGGRVIAVGTTSVRTLESVAGEDGRVREESGSTGLFIRPPYEFKCVDVLLTNFHLPKSSLLMLVSAFAGRERILDAYEEAVRERYRFYSYGDAMLIL
jgi:S-adenosylmethionine:tRNA ribosyltransferase-isomerase